MKIMTKIKKINFINKLRAAGAYIKKHSFVAFVIFCAAAALFGALFSYINNDIKYRVLESAGEYKEATKIVFKDKLLEDEVRSQIKKWGGNIYDIDVENLKSLTIDQKSIKSADGLQYFTGLKTLELTNCKLTDIDFISKLHNLEKVDLSFNEISDISPLEGLRNINDLNISNNEVEDLSPVYSLKNLVSLNAGHNDIGKINSKIRELSELKLLDLSANRLNDMGVFSGMKGISELTLSGNHIFEVKPLDNMVSLKKLKLNGNSIEKVTNFGQLPQIEELDIDTNNLTDLSFAANYSQLLTLSVNDNDITSIDTLKNNKSLQKLSIRGTEVKDLSVLKTLPDFNEIYIDNDVDRSQLLFMLGHFKDGDRLTKQYMLNYKDKLGEDKK